MLVEYIAIAVMIAVATLIAFIAIGLGELFGPKKKSAAKDMPYESGMNPYGEGTRRMPVRFYLIAVLFILFDIEVVFFLPWAIAFRNWVSLAWSRWWSLSSSCLSVMSMPGKKEP
jgi:NADH-quinone oxidoreductase subunit A